MSDIRWRVGRSVPRNLYYGDEPIAMLPTPELAGVIAVGMNAVTDLQSQLEAARKVIAESNEVCVCGCPADTHENYGEDGEGCGIDSHECVRTCIAVRDMLEAAKKDIRALDRSHLEYTKTQTKVGDYLRQQIAALTAENERLQLLLPLTWDGDAGVFVVSMGGILSQGTTKDEAMAAGHSAVKLTVDSISRIPNVPKCIHCGSYFDVED